jgi:hypothetical protein
MRKILWLVVFMLGKYAGFCQEADPSLFKLWSEEGAIQWKDYTITQEKRILKTGFLANAITSYYYRFIPGDWDVYDCINVATLFIKSDSWVTDTLNQAVLEHENIHFDIGELYARKMRKELHALLMEEIINHEIYGMKIDSLFKEVEAYQDLYDQETFYGQIKSMQQLWKDRIANELKQLEDFTFERMRRKCDKIAH